MLEQLLSSGDFLSLTRDNEWHLAPFSHQLENGTRFDVWDTGVIAFTPKDAKASDKDIVLSCAVHGNETAPIEILAELVQGLIQQTLEVKQRVLFLFGNPAAMNIGQRFVEENMNRLFSGAYADGGIHNKERERAGKLEAYITRFYGQGGRLGPRERFHYDLHTAIRGSKNEKFAVYPYQHDKPWHTSQLAMMAACGVNTILLSDAPTTTFSYFAANNFNAHAFTVELGQVKPFGENDMSRFAAVKDTLTRFVTGQPLNLKPFDFNDFELFEVYKTINRYSEDFVLNFADDVENFTDFPVGAELARDGETVHLADKPGESIIFPNAKVALGQRALLTVTPINRDEHTFT